MALSKRLQFLLLLCLCLSGKVTANIYTFTGDDGSVHLSNVPTDRRYTVLLREPNERAAAPSVGKGAPALANKALYDHMVDDVARNYGLESALLHAVISVESKYNPNAVSPKGARGMMQLMPQTAKRYGVANALDPAQNIDGGARYLRDLMQMFDNDVTLALAAYNAGESAVAKYGNRIPPFRETSNYVPKVLSYYRQYQGRK